MQVVPLECEKLKRNIQNNMETFKILDEFMYKFTEEDVKKKWSVFGGPKDIVEIMDTQKGVLEKEKLKFRDRMENE